MLCCSEFDDARLSMWGLAPTPRPDSARLSEPCATGISLRVQSARGSQRIFFGITGVERPGPPYPAGSRSPDLWFQHFAIVVSDMDAAYARLRAAGVPPISFGGPETLPEQNGGVRAFKFREPDGHPLELLWFPPGQGRANLAAAGRLVFGHRPQRYCHRVHRKKSCLLPRPSWSAHCFCGDKRGRDAGAAGRSCGRRCPHYRLAGCGTGGAGDRVPRIRKASSGAAGCRHSRGRRCACASDAGCGQPARDPRRP